MTKSLSYSSISQSGGEVGLCLTACRLECLHAELGRRSLDGRPRQLEGFRHLSVNDPLNLSSRQGWFARQLLVVEAVKRWPGEGMFSLHWLGTAVTVSDVISQGCGCSRDVDFSALMLKLAKTFRPINPYLKSSLSHFTPRN
ncbi:hypothetical protein RRG08_053027 [Elysia crispata]|uniref:Uncharacterized protein n=1 Tax=Elysia crispata TaxID=231223 RepID=A0AAE0Y4X6_9GAST|nr:hypothetical protein RRG08_053027 [Elysia crispata]